MGMWTNDIVYGGEQLEASITLDAMYIVWDAGIVAENVVTSLGNDGVKAEVVISEYNGEDADITTPAKFGTFASTIVEKIKQRGEGDLPAIVKFQKVESKQFATDAFVMTFVQPYKGTVPDLPPINAINLVETPPY